MLHYAVVFFVIALIAAVLGFGGIAASAAGIAKLLFVVFLGAISSNDPDAVGLGWLHLVSIVVALADRFDSLVGCFAVGLSPTGAADPFALRRACIAILRTRLKGVDLGRIKPWKDIARDNSPAPRDYGVPMLIAQNQNDSIVSPAVTKAFDTAEELGPVRIVVNCAGTGIGVKTAGRKKETGEISAHPLDGFAFKYWTATGGAILADASAPRSFSTGCSTPCSTCAISARSAANPLLPSKRANRLSVAVEVPALAASSSMPHAVARTGLRSRNSAMARLPAVVRGSASTRRSSCPRPDCPNTSSGGASGGTSGFTLVFGMIFYIYNREN